MDILSAVFIAVPLAIAPGIAISFFIYFRDKFEKEPFRLLRNCFLFGMLSIIPAVALELLAGKAGIDDTRNTSVTLVYAFLVVGLAEEMSKFAVLRWYVYKKPAFNEPLDGIVYSVMISMGFATVENILYAITGGIGTSLLRMFSAVPLHAATAVFMGYFAGKARFSAYPSINLLIGLVAAIGLHGLYDFFLFLHQIPALAIISFVLLAASVFLALLAIKKHRRLSPFAPK